MEAMAIQVVEFQTGDTKLERFLPKNQHKGNNRILRIGLMGRSKLYIPSTLNIDLILWHTQLIVCAVKC